MAGHTNRLNLYLPGGGSTGVYVPDEQADIDKINQDFVTLDAAVGAPSFTSGTRPPSPYDGQTIFETDTKNVKVFSTSLGQWQSASASARGTGADFIAATPAALHALAGQAVAGDYAYLVGDAVNFGHAIFIYDGAHWTTPVVQFLSAAGAMAAFLTYCNIGVNTSINNVGGLGTIAGVVPVYFNGSRWARVGVIPPSAAPTVSNCVATLNDDGSVHLVFSGAGTALLPGVLNNALYDTDIFDVEASMTGGTANTVNFKLGAAGVADVSTVNYDWYGPSWPQTGVVTALSNLGGPNWGGMFASISAEIEIELRHANLPVVTEGFMRIKDVQTLGTAQHGTELRIDHKASTAWTDIQIIVLSACTIDVKVKPRP